MSTPEDVTKTELYRAYGEGLHPDPKPLGKFIEFPNGDCVRAGAIVAIRLGDGRPAGGTPLDCELRPRVIVDYSYGERFNTIVVNCESDEARNQLAADLRAQIEGTPA